MEWFVAPDYWIGRLVFQRGLAVLYVVAFLGAALQFRALIGEHGMLPVPRYVRRVRFRDAPSVFRLAYSDRFFAAWAWTGCGVSAALAAGVDGYLPLWAAMALWLVPWAMYLSIVTVGQTWYAFGWESLLLEAGFLAVLLGNDEVAPPVAVLFLLRWLLFRVEFGAGLIKMRGDPCWRRPDLPRPPPRDPADAGAAELVLPPPAETAAPRRDGREPRHPTRRPLPAVHPPAARDRRGLPDDRDAAVAGAVGQLLLAELDDDRARRDRGAHPRHRAPHGRAAALVRGGGPRGLRRRCWR